MNALMAMQWLKYSEPQPMHCIAASFKELKKVFVSNKKGFVYIYDYAHHPTEIDAVHQLVNCIPIKSVLRFQPHLFSRTRDFADDFAKSLSRFDELF
jgi:UDP-N-acetylmuramate--alanine ligase